MNPNIDEFVKQGLTAMTMQFSLEESVEILKELKSGLLSVISNKKAEYEMQIDNSSYEIKKLTELQMDLEGQPGVKIDRSEPSRQTWGS
jgi:hypothetical protein